MPLPICVKCGKEMRCAKNEFLVTNGIYLWSGDKYRCPVCETEVVVGFGQPTDLNDPESWGPGLLKRAKVDGSFVEVDNL